MADADLAEQAAPRDAVGRYLAEHPERVAALTQLAHDANVATEAAAAAAVEACVALAGAR